MKNNFAVEGGILHLTSNGKIEFENSVFEQNYAVSSSIYVQESIRNSFISNSNFTSNKALNKFQIIEETI